MHYVVTELQKYLTHISPYFATVHNARSLVM